MPPSAADVAQGADELRRCAAELVAAADVIGARTSRAALVWRGQTAETAVAHAIRISNVTRRNAAAVGQASAALRVYAELVASARQRLDVAAAECERFEASRQQLGPVSTKDILASFDLSGLAADARRRRDSATDDIRLAAADCAARIRAAMAELVVPPPAASTVIPRGSHPKGALAHAGLDLLGMVPVLGEPADLANAVYYSVQGDSGNAALSMAGLIPFAGDAAMGARLGREALDVARDVDHASEAARAVSDAGKVERRADLLPNVERAVVDRRKVVDYALNDAHPTGSHKARVIRAATGFDASNADELIEQLTLGLREQPAVPGIVDEFGQRFSVDIPVHGPTGHAIVRTGWITPAAGGPPRLTTLYIP